MTVTKGLYADFIEDRLAENSEYIRLLKFGIQIFKPIWLEDNFRQVIKYDCYQLINNFFKNVKQEYTDEEKLFIYKSVYCQAGFRESMQVLGSFVEGLDIQISDLNDGAVKPERIGVDGRNLLKFTQEDQSYTVSADKEIVSWFYQKDGRMTEVNLQNLSPGEELVLSLSELNQRVPTSISSENRGDEVLLFDGSPYLNGILPEGVPFSLLDENGEILDEFEKWENTGEENYFKIAVDSVASAAFGSTMYYVKVINHKLPTYVSIASPKDSFVLELSTDRKTVYISNFSKEEPCLTAHRKHVEGEANVYTFDFTPYLVLSDGIEVPPVSDDTFTYAIDIKASKEVFFDYDLANTQIKELMRELLFYAGEDITEVYFSGIAFETNIVNTITNTLNITPKIYRFAVITDENITSHEYGSQTITVSNIGDDYIVTQGAGG